MSTACRYARRCTNGNVVQALRNKVGRKQPCPCGIGKKCWGVSEDLHRYFRKRISGGLVMKILIRLLVALGAALSVYALFMETTVLTRGGDRVHNIGLQSDRQLLLFLGCFMVLIGVILYGLRRLRQTPEQEAEEAAASAAAKEAVTGAATRVAKTASRGAGLIGQGIRDRLNHSKNDNLTGRLSAGLLVALCTIPASSVLLVWWALPLITLLTSVLVYRPAASVIRILLHFNVWWTLIHVVLFVISTLAMEDWRREGILEHTPLGTLGL
jgi:hypothetical protein